jgi:hypothetical protein
VVITGREEFLAQVAGVAWRAVWSWCELELVDPDSLEFERYGQERGVDLQVRRQVHGD